MVMLSSHDSEGECSITTANLDGETNLKVKSSASWCSATVTKNREWKDFSSGGSQRGAHCIETNEFQEFPVYYALPPPPLPAHKL